MQNFSSSRRHSLVVALAILCAHTAPQAATPNPPSKVCVGAVCQTSPDVVSADGALYSSVPFGQIPANGFWFLNNNFGKGRFVNGIDYKSTLTAHANIFPNGALFEWNWPDASSGSSFAYAYPILVYGGTPYGNPYNIKGPWPQKVNANRKLVANYDITLGGNKNSYNVLLDIYVTASPTTTDGSVIAEISFFPHFDKPDNLTGLHDFTWGRASVTKTDRQIMIRPVTANNTPLKILSGSIDIREIFTHLISLGWITGDEYLRGAEFGVEVQVPQSFNSLPHQGTMTVNRLDYVWQ